MRGQREDGRWNGRSDGYAIGMECEGSAGWRIGKGNQSWLHTSVNTTGYSLDDG